MKTQLAQKAIKLNIDALKEVGGTVRSHRTRMAARASAIQKALPVTLATEDVMNDVSGDSLSVPHDRIQDAIKRSENALYLIS